jgi:hypothetical protein
MKMAFDILPSLLGLAVIASAASCGDESEIAAGTPGAGAIGGRDGHGIRSVDGVFDDVTRAIGEPPQQTDPGSPSWVDVSPNAVHYAYVPLQNDGFQVLDGAKSDQTLYLGTCGQGVWKSDDEGATWIPTAPLDSNSGRNWSLVVDFNDSNTVYAISGHGIIQGLWKTTDGGTSWSNVQGAITNRDLGRVAMDPTDHLHVLVTEQGGAYALWETFDGAKTWTNRGAPWGQSNAYVLFLGYDDAGQPDSSYWIALAENCGLWRTTNAGTTWQELSTTLLPSRAGAGMYRAANGALYLGVNGTIVRSSDNGRSWEDLAVVGNLPTSSDAYAGIVGDGTQIYSMLSSTGVSTAGPYSWYVTSESGDGRTWSRYNLQTFQDGPLSMIFDRANRIVYASQWSTGVFRLPLP